MKYTKETLEPIIKNSNNYTEVLLKLNLSTHGDNRKTIKKYVDIFNIDTTHFYRTITRRINNSKELDLLLIENSTYSRTNLKKRLLKEGIKKEECEICGQKNEWNGKHLIMILDHINGIYNDNRLENLRMVCPNCNYQLETTAGKNKNKNSKSNNTCKDCSKPIIKGSRKYCNDCRYNIKSRKFFPTKVPRPSFIELVENLRTSDFKNVGKFYGVSDTSIRKWVKSYKQEIENNVIDIPKKILNLFSKIN